MREQESPCGQNPISILIPLIRLLTQTRATVYDEIDRLVQTPRYRKWMARIDLDRRDEQLFRQDTADCSVESGKSQGVRKMSRSS